MNATQQRTEALDRARSGQSTSNLATIYAGFESMGISEDDILPRENVFTFAAWRALGRTVRRGQHGVKVLTWIPIDGKLNEETGKIEGGGKRCKSATVFHVSQTATFKPKTKEN